MQRKEFTAPWLTKRTEWDRDFISADVVAEISKNASPGKSISINERCRKWILIVKDLLSEEEYQNQESTYLKNDSEVGNASCLRSRKIRHAWRILLDVDRLSPIRGSQIHDSTQD